MYYELNTVFSLSSLVMVALYSGNTKVAQPERKAQSPKNSEDAVKYFNPHSNSIACGLCSYKFTRNKVSNRIPEVITEVHCDSPGSRCHKELLFHCLQETARLEVATVHTRQGSLELRAVRNITVNIGCSCSAQKLRLVDLVSRGVRD